MTRLLQSEKLELENIASQSQVNAATATKLMCCSAQPLNTAQSLSVSAGGVQVTISSLPS